MNSTADKIRLAGLCGIVGPLTNLAGIFIAISISPWFSWFGNALSDLGVRNAAPIFNASLIIGGLLNLALAAGLFVSFERRKVMQAGAVILFLTGFALIGIGIFTESFGAIHLYFSVAFFVLLPISLWVMGAGALMAKSKFGLFSVLMGLLAATPWIFAWPAVAVPEMLTAFVASAWSIVQGSRLLDLGRP